MKTKILPLALIPLLLITLSGCFVQKQVEVGQDQIDKTKEVVKQLEDQDEILDEITP